jgi:hypothetical protein
MWIQESADHLSGTTTEDTMSVTRAGYCPAGSRPAKDNQDSRPEDESLPESKDARYFETLRLVRQLSSGKLTRDPHAKLIGLSEEPPKVVVPVEGPVYYHECRACKYRYPNPPKSCTMCGCQYFDQRREF